MRVIFLSLIVIGLCSCAPSSAPSAETIVEGTAKAVGETPEIPETRVIPNPAPEPAELNEDLPEEDLGIVVVGRIAGDDGAATLKLPSGKKLTYRRGDEIMSGVTLKAIDKNFVLIDVKGQETKLPVSKGWTPSNIPGGYNAHQPSRRGFSVKADGSVFDSTGKKFGHVNGNGDIIDTEGRVIGRVRPPSR